MTERDFWQETALAWLNAKVFPDTGNYCTLGMSGICPLVNRVINTSIRVSAQAKLDKYLPKRHTTYCGHCWATNRHGARSRALFCLRMATLCPGDDTKIATAREAWFFLARLWSQATLNKTYGSYQIPLYGGWMGWPTGLCSSIDVLYRRGRIEVELHRKLEEALNTNLPKKNITDEGHRWAMNRHGARSRTLFCLRMAGLSK